MIWLSYLLGLIRPFAEAASLAFEVTLKSLVAKGASTTLGPEVRLLYQAGTYVSLVQC